MEFATFATLPDFEWIGDAPDHNEGLRQILMVHPDVIVVPWSAAALKLLRALVFMREQGISPLPLVVALTPEAPRHELLARDGVITVGADRFGDDLADRLRQLRAALTQNP
jgi:hypothetical protein